MQAPPLNKIHYTQKQLLLNRRNRFQRHRPTYTRNISTSREKAPYLDQPTTLLNSVLDAGMFGKQLPNAIDKGADLSRSGVNEEPPGLKPELSRALKAIRTLTVATCPLAH